MLKLNFDKLTNSVCHGGVRHSMLFAGVGRLDESIEMPVIDPESPFVSIVIQGEAKFCTSLSVAKKLFKKVVRVVLNLVFKR